MKTTDQLVKLNDFNLVRYDNSKKGQLKIQYQQHFGFEDDPNFEQKIQAALKGHTKSYHYSYKEFRNNISKQKNLTFMEETKIKSKNNNATYAAGSSKKELVNAINKCVSYMVNKSYRNAGFLKNQTEVLNSKKTYEQNNQDQEEPSDTSSISEKYEIYIADDLDYIVQQSQRQSQSKDDSTKNTIKNKPSNEQDTKETDTPQPKRLATLNLNERLKFLQNRNQIIGQKQYNNIKQYHTRRQYNIQNYNKVAINFGPKFIQKKILNQQNNHENISDVETPLYSVQQKSDSRKIRSASGSRKLPVRQQGKSTIPPRKTSAHVYAVIECKK